MENEHSSVKFHQERREALVENLWSAVEYVPGTHGMEPDLEGFIQMIAVELDALDVEVPFL